MSASNNNAVPIILSVLLHCLLLASMLVAFDFARPTPITPLAIQATLVSDLEEIPRLAIAEEPESVPEPVEVEPEPVIDEPEPEPEPDNSVELQRQAEEEKRQQDALVEKERLEKQKKLEEQEKQKREREEREREKRDEEEKERKRIAAERKREDDIKRQREENERLRREQESELRQSELEADERRFAARNSAEMTAYQFAIARKIRRSWSVPASAGPETRCSVRVTQLPGGEVVAVNILSCNGDDAVKRSVEAAVRKSSPLPEPPDPDLFDRNLTLNLTLERED